MVRKCFRKFKIPNQRKLINTFKQAIRLADDCDKAIIEISTINTDILNKELEDLIQVLSSLNHIQR